MKRALLVMLMAIPLFTVAQTFSNAFFFGDSYTDIGNFPESTTVIGPYHHIQAQSLYIPTSNPVNTIKQQRYHVPGTNFGTDIPTLNPRLLPPRAMLDNIQRKYRSIGWTQYFLHTAHQQQLTQSGGITPSTQLPSEQQAALLSVNYAWYGALSTDTCTGYNYQLTSENCHRQEVLRHAFTYRNNQPQTSINSVWIPGLRKQIRFFLEDKAQQRIVTDKRSVYFILIGGNDISLAFSQFKSGNPYRMTQAVFTLLSTLAFNVHSAAKTLLSNGANTLYLVSYPNLSHVPEVYHMTDNRYIRLALQTLASFLTKHYNHQLKTMVIPALRKEFPQATIKWVPFFQAIEKLTAIPKYAEKIRRGERCIDSSNLYLTAQGDPNNCAGFVYWNNAHFTSTSNQVMAFTAIQALNSR